MKYSVDELTVAFLDHHQGQFGFRPNRSCTEAVQLAIRWLADSGRLADPPEESKTPSYKDRARIEVRFPEKADTIDTGPYLHHETRLLIDGKDLMVKDFHLQFGTSDRSGRPSLTLEIHPHSFFITTAKRDTLKPGDPVRIVNGVIAKGE